MRQKATLLISIIFILTISLLYAPQTAFAASHTITSGGTYDIAALYADDDIVTIATSDEVTLTGSKNIQVVCNAGADLVLSSVTIDVSATSVACAISFTGTGNTLELVGVSVVKSGSDEPGIRVEDTTALTISGSGSIEAKGGWRGAGIGGGFNGAGGTITINSGTVTATGGDYGAGIGGGHQGAGGTITINDGTVTATGGSSAAGIGGGNNGVGGTITINDGTVTATGGGTGAGIGGGNNGVGGTITIDGGEVTATGGDYGAGIGGGTLGAGGTITINSGTVTATGGQIGAGIGGGNNGVGGTITINDGTVTATGGDYGAGIGGGYTGAGGIIEIDGGTVRATGGDGGAGIGGGRFGEGGTITLDGGNIFAERGASGTYDIGSGYGTTGGTLTISSDAGVFLRNDASLAPSTATHTHYPVTSVVSGKLFGIDAPTGWTQGSGYILPCTASYDNNGATGSVADDIIHRNGVAVVKSKGDLAYSGMVFSHWNTMANGAGASYNPGAEITLTSDMTIYAIWIHPATPTPIPTATPTQTPTATPAATATPTASDATASPAVTSATPTSASTTTKPKTTSKTITSTPTPLATAAPTATATQTATPAPELTATPEPSEETKLVVPAEIISEDDADGNVTVQINKNDLPVGTTAVSTPSGEVIAFGDEDTVQITVSKDELGNDGALELVLLNNENVAFGEVDVQVAAQPAPVVEVPKAAPKPINIVLWIIGGIALVAVILAAIYIIQARIRFG